MTTDNPYNDMRTGTPAPKIRKAQYRFKFARPPYSKGDLVPQQHFTKGELQTMLDYGRIELVPGNYMTAEERVEDGDIPQPPTIDDKPIFKAKPKRKEAVTP